MKKMLVFLTVILLGIIPLKGITPQAYIPASLPSYSTYNRGALIDSMRSVYLAGLIFTAQVRTMNEIPVVTLSTFPSERMLSSISKQDIVVFADDYYNNAFKLKEQVAGIDSLAVRIDSMLSTIRKMELDLIKKDYEVFNAVNACIKEKMELSTKLNLQCKEYLSGIYEMCDENYKNSISILSVSPVGNWYIFDNPKINSDISMGVRFDFNAYPLLRFNKNIEFWGEYTAPKISTVHHYEYFTEDGDLIEEGSVTHRWAIDLYSLGISYAVRNAFSITDDTDVGFKFGIGHIWGEGKIYNSYLPKTTWTSNVVRVEANVVKYRWFFPVEFFAAYNWHTNSKDLQLPTHNDIITHNSPWLNTLQLGLRISFWWHPNIK